jgi:hypothetical protein
MYRQVRRLIAAALLLLVGSPCLATGPGRSVALAATPGRSIALASSRPGRSARIAAGPSRSARIAAGPSRSVARTERAGARGPTEVTLPPGPAGGGIQIAMRPVGLSLEYPTMAQDLGPGPCPPAALIAELRRLGSPPLALAGESQDLTAPPEALTGVAPSWETATLYPLPGSFWGQLHCLLSGAGDPLSAGLNLRKGVPSWAAQMVAGAQSAATNGLEFSLGNEPDLYSLHNYAALAAPLPDAELAAVNLYLQLAEALRPTVGALPVTGPELAIPALWRRQLPRIVAQLHDNTVGVHMYPLSTCDGPGGATLPRLLSSAAADAPRSLAWVVADARAAGVPAILSEANSASCGGRAGVSDTPAAAVWAVRFVLAALKTGFREVRFHFSGGSYDPFLVRGASVIDRPLESALVALNQWLPVGAAIRTLPGVHGLVATAIGAAPGAPQLILDNEGARPQTVVLRGARTVQVELLSATRAGPQTAQLGSTGGRVKVAVAPNSVLAVLGSNAAA